MENNENNITSKYEEYFKEDLSRLDNEFSEMDKFDRLLSENIEKAQKSETRGSLHYMIEHCKNLISLKTQKQGIMKDKVNLKKIIMDYAIKENSGTEDGKAILQELNKFIRDRKTDINHTQSKPSAESDIDAEIDKLLENEDKNE